MRDGAYITNGTKSIPLASLRPDAWTPADPYELFGGDAISVRTGQTHVPTLYRAIDIRAKAVAGMPFRLERNGADVTNDDDMRLLIKRLRNLLYLTEASLCCYNAAYWELGTNRAGRNLTPFWLATPTIQPDITSQEGLKGFYRTGGTFGYMQPRQVCYFWGPSIAVEIGADPLLAPVAVTLGAAGLLYSLERFASGFFQRGAVKVTLLTVEGNPKQDEIEKLDSWWKRMVSGVKNAFGSVVIRSSVKPVVIGSNVNETSAPALTKLSREDVAIGMGVPMSLLFSNALAGGTAAAERLNFYDFTVVPECEHVIDEPLNARYLDQLGLRLIWTPEKLEVYQSAELSKAQSLAQLTGGQLIITVDEARERLELPPLADVLPPEPQTPPALPGPAGEASAGATPEAPISLLLPGTLDALGLKARDLLLWQKKALDRFKAGKSLDFAFRSDAIGPDEAALISYDLAHATTVDAVKAAFQPGQNLTDDERALYDRLAATLDKHGTSAVQAILSGRNADLPALSADIRASLTSAIASAVGDRLAELAAEIGPSFDLATTGQDIAGAYVSKYMASMEATTRAALEKAVTVFRVTPGMGRADLVSQLSGAFGPRRAELVAVTALTEASNQATEMYQAKVADAGIVMERVWRTANDEISARCVICGPLNGKPESEWKDRFPHGGPAHGKCRCGTTLRLKK